MEKVMRYNPDKECEKIIKRIQKLCEIKDMTRYAVATKAEISNSTMHSLMTGKTKPYAYTLFKLCNALDVPIESVVSDIFLDYEDRVADGKEWTCPGQQKLGWINYERMWELKTLLPDEKDVLLCYRYLSERKKEIMRIMVDMLRQYNVGEE